MTLTLTELKRVVAELNETLLGGRLQKIGQPSQRAIVLQVRVPGQTHHVYLCAARGSARVHLLSLPLKNPSVPPQFCTVLRKHLLGACIRSIELLSGDRIVAFLVEGEDSHGSRVEHRLVVEIIPGYENVILLDENRMVVAALHHAASRDAPRIAPRRMYQPPPPVEAQEAAEADRFEEPLRALTLATYSAAVEQAYAQEDQSAHEENLRREIASMLAKLTKRTKRRLAKIEEDLEAAGQSDLLRHKGELLKANLHAVRKGQPSVEVEDTISPSGGKVTIDLDAALSPQENMQRYFKRARKLRGGRPIIEERLEEARKDVAELRELQEQVKVAEGLEALQYLSEKMPRAPKAGKKGKTREVRSLPRKFISADGQLILVGRNPLQNDDITLHAAGDDIWLHVQHYGGSHVIIKMKKDKPLLKETLLDAAHLALHFSKLRDASKAPIDYTKRKYVRKTRNAPPGRVSYSQQKTMMLVPDKRRLERLMRKKRPRNDEG